MARQERRARTEARNNMRQTQDVLKEEERKQGVYSKNKKKQNKKNWHVKKIAVIILKSEWCGFTIE